MFQEMLDLIAEEASEFEVGFIIFNVFLNGLDHTLLEFHTQVSFQINT